MRNLRNPGSGTCKVGDIPAEAVHGMHIVQKGDSMISFTTTVFGRVDVAFVLVDQLIEATK